MDHWISSSSGGDVQVKTIKCSIHYSDRSNLSDNVSIVTNQRHVGRERFRSPHHTRKTAHAHTRGHCNNRLACDFFSQRCTWTSLRCREETSARDKGGYLPLTMPYHMQLGLELRWMSAILTCSIGPEHEQQATAHVRTFSALWHTPQALSEVEADMAEYVANEQAKTRLAFREKACLYAGPQDTVSSLYISREDMHAHIHLVL